MKSRRYFVSYQFANTKVTNSYGFGCTDLELTDQIKGFSDVQIMIDYIKKMIKTETNQAANVVILYWRPFEGQEL